MFVMGGFVLIIIAAIEAFNGNADTAWKAMTLGNIFLTIFYIADLKREILNLEKFIKGKENPDSLGDVVNFKDLGRKNNQWGDR